MSEYELTQEAAKLGVSLYKESDLHRSDYDGKWQFIASMISSSGAAFKDLEDNYDVRDVLRKAKVLLKNDVDDCESCCSYFYFKSKQDARAFVKRLNKYMVDRAGRLQDRNDRLFV